MCGASSQQESLEASQASYYQTLQQQASAEFGQSSKIFQDLTSTFEPILAAGPGQTGYTTGEVNNLNSIAATTQGQAYSTSEQAINRQLAATGAGLPSGVATKIRTGLAGSSAQNLASEQQTIQQNNYAQGNQNWLTAAQALSGATGVYGTANGAAGAANQGGSAASETANEIAQESNGWESMVGGLLGGAASAATSFGLKSCYVAARIWGGWDAPETSLVRRYIFTDFNQTWYGKILANFYNKHGQWMAKHDIIVYLLKPFFRVALQKAKRKYINGL